MKNGNAISWRIAGLVLVAIFLGLSSCDEAGVTNPYNATLVFEQIDYDLGGFTGIDSSWGMVTLTYTGISDVLYFNLAINGIWVIQNISVLSIYGAGVQQSYTFSFDLGVDQGTDVTQLQYAFDLTNNVLNTMPTQTNISAVSDGSYVVYSGGSDTEDFKNNFHPPNTYILAGGDAINTAKLPDADKLPNQQAGLKECIPVAVSNSLHYLSDTSETVNLTDDEMSIDEMKLATNWVEDYGCPVYHTEEQGAWWETKDDYMQTCDYPITTEHLLSPDIGYLFVEIKRGQDVEMIYWWGVYDCSHEEPVLIEEDGKPVEGYHCVNVTGLVEYVDGSYTISFSHDSNQKDPTGGLRSEELTVIFNNDSGVYECWIDLGLDEHGRELKKTIHIVYFVVECPEE